MYIIDNAAIMWEKHEFIHKDITYRIKKFPFLSHAYVP